MMLIWCGSRDLILNKNRMKSRKLQPKSHDFVARKVMVDGVICRVSLVNTADTAAIGFGTY